MNMFSSPSKVIFKWDKEKEWTIHKEKIKHIKCSVDHINNLQSIIAEQRARAYRNSKYANDVELNRQNKLFINKLYQIEQGRRRYQSQSISQSVHHNISLNNQGQSEQYDNSISKQSKQNNYINQQTLEEKKQIQAYFRRIEATKSVFDINKWEKEANEHSKIVNLRRDFSGYLLPRRVQTQNSRLSLNWHERGIGASASAEQLSTNNLTTSSIQVNEKVQDNDKNNAPSSSGSEQKIIAIGNIVIPSTFYQTGSNDGQKVSMIKKLMNNNKKVLYRKPVCIQQEQLFAEVKIEQGQFIISLENTKGEVYVHSMLQKLGEKLLDNECNGDFNQLFNKIQLNSSNLTMTIIQDTPLKYKIPSKQKRLSQIISQHQSNNTNNCIVNTDVLDQKQPTSNQEKQRNLGVRLPPVIKQKQYTSQNKQGSLVANSDSGNLKRYASHNSSTDKLKKIITHQNNNIKRESNIMSANNNNKNNNIVHNQDMKQTNNQSQNNQVDHKKNNNQSNNNQSKDANSNKKINPSQKEQSQQPQKLQNKNQADEEEEEYAFEEDEKDENGITKQEQAEKSHEKQENKGSKQQKLTDNQQTEKEEEYEEELFEEQ